MYPGPAELALEIPNEGCDDMLIDSWAMPEQSLLEQVIMNSVHTC